jgi:hypothetical protein
MEGRNIHGETESRHVKLKRGMNTGLLSQTHSKYCGYLVECSI